VCCGQGSAFVEGGLVRGIGVPVGVTAMGEHPAHLEAERSAVLAEPYDV
jgi:hypothetical protein